MIVIMQRRATDAQVNNVIARVEQHGCRVHLSEGEERVIIGVVGTEADRPVQFERMSGVERAVPVLRPFKLASRSFTPRTRSYE